MSLERSMATKEVWETICNEAGQSDERGKPDHMGTFLHLLLKYLFHKNKLYNLDK